MPDLKLNPEGQKISKLLTRRPVTCLCQSLRSENQSKMNQDRKSSINRVIGLNVNKDAEIMVPLKHYETKKSKRFRSAFTTEQINYLENEFKKIPYIGSANRKEVANTLRISERAVKIWFQNRRMKEKKENNNKEFIVNQNNSKVEFANAQLNNERDLQPHYGCIKFSQISSNDCPKEPNTQFGNENKLLKTCTTSQNKTKIKNNATTSQRNFEYEKLSPQKEKVSRFTNAKQVRKDTKTVPVLPPLQGTFTYLDNLEKERKRNNKDMRRQNHQVFETPVDLSSKTTLLDKPPLKNPQHIPALASSQEYVSMYTNNYSTTPLPPSAAVTRFPDQIVTSIPPGNIIWKPVNMIPPSGLAPVSLPHSNGFPVFNHIPKVDCNCNCNCHGLSQGINPGFTQEHTPPQYIIAIPFSNNACTNM